MGNYSIVSNLSRCLPVGMLVLVLGMNLGDAARVQAATLTVDRLDDVASAAGCEDTVPDDCSLRGAVSKANGAPDHDDIIVPAGTYALSVAAPCTFKARIGENALSLSSVVLCLNSDLSIVGVGAEKTIIHGNRVDKVIAVSSSTTVSINGVTIRDGGLRPLTFGSGGGGGILNHGTLTVSDSMVTANDGGNIGGGGIYNYGELTVFRSVITKNIANGSGGGIFNYGNAGAGVLKVESSTISDNASGELGGGIMNFNGGLVTVTGSTVSVNSAVGSGGGINNNNFSTLTVINSTISGNRADSAAGLDNAFMTTLHNVTITANIAGTPGSGRGVGGGLRNQDASPLKLQNTIIAGNTAHNPAFVSPDCAAFAGRNAALTSQGYNLIQNTANCDISGDLTGNIIGQDPSLGALTANGGLTPTHALADNSPAIDAGSPVAPGSGDTACAASDQRGFLRPLGARCDIGAFERSEGFSLTRVLPSLGGNTGSVSAVISGNGFVKGTTVVLTRAGQPDIVGNPQQVDVGGSAITVVFDLAGKQLGPWDVVVTNPDGSKKTLAGGFTVEQGRAPQLWVDIIGRFFRPGRPSRLTVLYGNRGNVDAVGVPFSLSFPEGYAPRRFFALTPPPPQPGQVRDDWSQAPVAVLLDAQSGFINIPLLLPVVPAGFTGILQIGLTLPIGAQDNSLLTAIGEPLFNPGLDPTAVSNAVAGARAYLESSGVTVSPALNAELEQYASNQLRLVVENGRPAFVASLGTQVQIYSMAQLHFDLALFGVVRAAASPQAAVQPADIPGWISTAHRLFTSLLSQLGPAEAQAQQQNCPPAQKGKVLGDGCSGGEGPNEPFLPPEIPPPPGCNPRDPTTIKNCGLTPAHCESLPGYKVQGDACVPDKPSDNCSKFGANPVGGNAGCIKFPLRPRDSLDPNDKVGTLGATNDQFFLGATPLSYTINFENLETATAAAQEVIITDQLDVNTLDLNTLSLGPIVFSENNILVPAPGVQQYTGGIDLRPAQNLIVTVRAGLDKSTGLLSWHFISIDPDTGQFTEDPLAGFLPPNTTPPAGEGGVSFTINPKAALATGTRICNQARIVFDTNAPLDTPQWCNTIDRSVPTSQVAALAASQTSPTFTVQWTGTDSGAGIGSYTVFVSENGGPFTPFVSDTSNTSAQFTGQMGKTYAFYSIARDLVGNEEAPPTTADTQTVVGGLDQCPDDPNKNAPGLCGCGTPDSVVGQACTTGQPGVCAAGITTCANGTRSCQPNTQPTAEVCDGLDNNCDGAVDDGNPGGGASCTTGQPGVCSTGSLQCTSGSLRCVQTTQPSAEVCGDGLDNNCNSVVDDGFNVGAACTIGVGVCQRTGSLVCTSNGTGTQCNATPGTPGVEICGNGIDEDCNGADLACPPPSDDSCTISTVLDNFNRANGAIGNNWRGVTETSFYRIVNSRLDAQLGGPLYWNATPFGTNQAGFITLSSVDSRSPSQGLLLKVQDGNVPNAGAIAVVYDGIAKAVRVSTLRLGTLTWQPYGNAAVPFVNGDKLGACAKANGEVRVYKNDVLVKTVILNTIDQNFFNTKGGKVGIWSFLAPQALIDDFGGATIAPNN